MAEGRMTKGERDDLIRLIKQRERVAKSAAKQRSAAMLAEFETSMSTLHEFNKNEVWAAAMTAATEAAKEANARIDKESARLGIPEEFRPKLHYGWARRGENEYKDRRTELRRVAKAEIETIEKAIMVHIETQSVNAQTEVISNGLATADAIAFLNNMQPVEEIMPALDIELVQQKMIEAARQKKDYSSPYLVED